ncbi:hypothetical protein IQ279_00290 [Streptomyces verrucosisporus]|uniref:hypothetical protein n=1 Tax=Streptomyces verrucosisporus TaxID=1695161 RepID=UPI0019CF63EA|nr:hypothetical protein [Streptomyces verrucosisporus]MBN3928093.1 hypothetical protein [Streptomyces verrucosisporus]
MSAGLPVPARPRRDPAQTAEAMGRVVRDSFLSGVGPAFTLARILAVLAAGIALSTKGGRHDTVPSVHV